MWHLSKLYNKKLNYKTFFPCISHIVFIYPDKLFKLIRFYHKPQLKPNNAV